MQKIGGGFLQELPAPIPTSVSECALYTGKQDTCLDKTDSDKIITSLGVSDIKSAKEAVGCDTEKCLVKKVKAVLGSRAEVALLQYKIDGPTDNKLLNNVNIDGILNQWALKWKDFYNYNFNMRDYAKHRFHGNGILNEPDSLATVKFAELYKEGFKTCACVINSDLYKNPGEHWMALFADARTPGQATVEFFNSSGGPPAPEWVNWLVKTQTGLRNAGIKKVEIINVCKIRHQDSMSECGVYSLFYIWARLNGVSYEYFLKNTVPDRAMFEFRQHLFANPTATEDGKFNWEEFQRQVKVKWS